MKPARRLSRETILRSSGVKSTQVFDAGSSQHQFFIRGTVHQN